MPRVSKRKNYKRLKNRSVKKHVSRKNRSLKKNLSRNLTRKNRNLRRKNLKGGNPTEPNKCKKQYKQLQSATYFNRELKDLYIKRKIFGKCKQIYYRNPATKRFELIDNEGRPKEDTTVSQKELDYTPLITVRPLPSIPTYSPIPENTSPTPSPIHENSSPTPSPTAANNLPVDVQVGVNRSHYSTVTVNPITGDKKTFRHRDVDSADNYTPPPPVNRTTKPKRFKPDSTPDTIYADLNLQTGNNTIHGRQNDKDNTVIYTTV